MAKQGQQKAQGTLGCAFFKFPLGRLERHHYSLAQQEATGGLVVHFGCVWHHQRVGSTLMIFMFVCGSPFGAGIPSLAGCLGINLTDEKSALPKIIW